MSDLAKRASEFDALRIHDRGDVVVVEISNPRNPLNTVDEGLHENLTRLFSLLRTESDARAVVLTGDRGYFSAGGDFAWLKTLREPSRIEALRRSAKQLIWDLVDVELPVIAAINGPAVGLGASIALLADVIFMGRNATIADPHVRVGLVAGDGGAVIWPALIGPARAKEFLLTGDSVDAALAEAMGLANHVVDDDRVLDEALAFATRLAEGAPLAIRYTKAAVNKLLKHSLNVAFDASTALELATMVSEDHDEALRALAEKRKPNFKGR